MQSRSLIAASLSTLALLMSTALTHAQTIVDSVLVTNASTPGPFTSFGEAPQALDVILPQFDTMGGTRILTGITFSIAPDPGTGDTATGTLDLSNHSRNPQTAVGNYAETLTLKFDDAVVAAGNETGPQFSTPVATQGTTPVSLSPLVISNTGTTLLPGSLPVGLTLSDFEGSGNLPVTTSGLHLVIDDQTKLTSHPSIDVASYSSTTSELVTITYSYTSAVPEPGAWAMLGGMTAFGGLSLIRRRRSGRN
jgi:hypothetical protein